MNATGKAIFRPFVGTPRPAFKLPSGNKRFGKSFLLDLRDVDPWATDARFKLVDHGAGVSRLSQLAIEALYSDASAWLKNPGIPNLPAGHRRTALDVDLMNDNIYKPGAQSDLWSHVVIRLSASTAARPVTFSDKVSSSGMPLAITQTSENAAGKAKIYEATPLNIDGHPAFEFFIDRKTNGAIVDYNIALVYTNPATGEVRPDVIDPGTQNQRP